MVELITKLQPQTHDNEYIAVLFRGYHYATRVDGVWFATVEAYGSPSLGNSLPTGNLRPEGYTRQLTATTSITQRI